MKVAVEIPYYAYGVRGPSQFGDNLVRTLAGLHPDDLFVVFNYFNRDYAAHRSRIEAKFKASNIEFALPRWSQRLVDFAERRLGYPFVDERFVAKSGVDVFHDNGAHPVDTHRTPLVYYVHGAPMDLIRIEPIFTSTILPQVLRAHRLACPSRCVRDFLLKHYPVNPKKVEVVYYGVDHDLFRPIKDAGALEAVRKKYSLPERFLLSVGPFQFRDNIEHILWLLHERREDPRLRGVRLVLVGGLEEHGQALVDRVKQLKLDDLVQFAGFVPHQDLAAVYNMAELVVHPSYYEELGAQLLEAGACGAPVLAAQSGGILEALGDGALYFNPHLIDEFGKLLLETLADKNARSQASARSLQWSKRFSWKTTADQMYQLYVAAASRR
ncbi:MAG: glycosyltransferase family 4 protein [Elusimicrobia bacterium]|nr:glycosyltransferase family 4 protein [Elusimicrobiota bacterium]